MLTAAAGGAASACDACGWAAAVFSMLGFGSFGVPIKSDAAKAVDIDPLVFQSYKTFMCFATSWLILWSEPFHFTPWGIVSGLFWVPGGVATVYAIKAAGLAIGIGIGSSFIVLVSFIWGIFVFEERVHSKVAACFAVLCMMLGLMGMSYFSSSEAAAAAAAASRDDDHHSVDEEQETTSWEQQQTEEHAMGRSLSTGPRTTSRDIEYQRLEDDEHDPQQDENDDDGATNNGTTNNGTTNNGIINHDDNILGPMDPKSKVSDRTAQTSPSDSVADEEEENVREEEEEEQQQTESLPVASGGDDDNTMQDLSSPLLRTSNDDDDNNNNNNNNNHSDLEMIRICGCWNISRRHLGMLSAMFCGIWGGSILAPMKWCKSDTKGTEYLISFSIGASLVTVSLWIMRYLCNVAYYRSFTTAYYSLPSFHFRVMWAPGGLAGLLWSIGNYFSLISVFYLGEGVGYPLSQTSILISGLWGIFYFGEVQGAELISKWILSSLLTIFGILLLSYEHHESETRSS